MHFCSPHIKGQDKVSGFIEYILFNSLYQCNLDVFMFEFPNAKFMYENTFKSSCIGFVMSESIKSDYHLSRMKKMVHMIYFLLKFAEPMRDVFSTKDTSCILHPLSSLPPPLNLTSTKEHFFPRKCF